MNDRRRAIDRLRERELHERVRRTCGRTEKVARRACCRYFHALAVASRKSGLQLGIDDEPEWSLEDSLLFDRCFDGYRSRRSISRARRYAARAATRRVALERLGGR